MFISYKIEQMIKEQSHKAIRLVKRFSSIANTSKPREIGRLKVSFLVFYSIYIL